MTQWGVTQIKEWYSCFKDGCVSMEDDQCSRRPSTSQNAAVIETVRTLIMEVPCLVVQEIADEVGTSAGPTDSILGEDLSMHLSLIHI